MMKSLGCPILIATVLLPLHSSGFTSSLKKHQSRIRTFAVGTDVLEDTAASHPQYHVPIHNIVRDLNGNPLTSEYFAGHMGIANVESYSCPKEDAFRGFMSNACRVKLSPGGQSAFYKCIVFNDIGHAWEKMKHAPFKLIRDIKSYEVVASFLQSNACQELSKKTGVRIPKCYDAKLKPNYEDPMDSKFSFLLEDLSPSDGWYQKWLVDSRDECEACLSTYAKIHAFFWHGSNFWKDKDAAKEFEAAVWKSGSYVQPHAQPLDQWNTLESEWAKKKMKFEEQLSSLEYWENLGERLQTVAQECGREAHPFAEDGCLAEVYEQYRTFTHGDPKQANIFFRQHSAEEDEGQFEIEIGLIDFQWSGFGLAASDVAHFLSSAVHADLLEGSGEDNLMRYYYNELQKYLVENGVFQSMEDIRNGYSWDVFEYQYETAVLDLCRLIIAYVWDRFDEAVDKGDEAAKQRTMNKTSYNKSISNAAWLMSRCNSILKGRGI